MGVEHPRREFVEQAVIRKRAIPADHTEMAAEETSDLETDNLSGRLHDPHPPRQAASRVRNRDRQQVRHAIAAYGARNWNPDALPGGRSSFDAVPGSWRPATDDPARSQRRDRNEQHARQDRGQQRDRAPT